MKAFYDVIEWFQPGYVLMENVLDIFKKQSGIYVKFAIAQLVLACGTRPASVSLPPASLARRRGALGALPSPVPLIHILFLRLILWCIVPG